MAKSLNRALRLTAVGATILLSACGSSTSVLSSSGTVSTPTANSAASTAPAVIPPPPSASVTSTERVVAWFVDGGKSELTRVTAAFVAIRRADAPGASYAGLSAACANAAAAVASAQAGPRVPEAEAEASFAGALADYAKGAVACQAGANAHDVALLNEAAAAIRAGTAELLRFDNQTKDAQSKRAQAAAARRCKQLFTTWKEGPAKSPLSRLLSALGTLQTAGAGTGAAAMSAEAKKAGQAAALLAPYPVPACADPSGNFAAILARVRAAATSVATARGLSAVTQALAPLKGVPALEAAFTSEVKLAAGA